MRSGVIVKDDVELSIGKGRVRNLVALNIDVLADYGLHPSLPDDEDVPA